MKRLALLVCICAFVLVLAATTLATEISDSRNTKSWFFLIMASTYGYGLSCYIIGPFKTQGDCDKIRTWANKLENKISVCWES